MKTMPAVELRWLDGDDLDQLEPILRERGWMSLNKSTTRVRAAFYEGRIVGFVCLQLVPHMEPLYVEPEFRGSPVAMDLVNDMAEFIRDARCRGVMIVAGAPGIEALAKHFGMEQITHPVYIKVDMGAGL